MYRTLADIVLVTHMSIAMFIVIGLLLIVIGNRLGIKWVNRLWFRMLHLASIAIVVAESWLDIPCPLTTLESWLRFQAGGNSYSQGFIEHWVQRALFYDLPTWVFTVAYSLFGVAVATAWWCYPPVRGKHAGTGNSQRA